MLKSTQVLISVLCVLALVYAAFSQVVENRATNWDDPVYVTKNPLVRELSVGSIKKIFGSFLLDGYQPLAILSFSLEYQLFGKNPRGYHLTNLLLHLSNCLLVFWLVFLLSNSAAVSCLVALLFGVHPLQAETVAWISERKGLLCGFFLFSSLIGYLLYLRRTGASARKMYLASLICFLLALFSKATAVTMPFLLLALDYYQKRRKDRMLFLDKAPYLALSLIFSFVAVAAHYSGTRVREPLAPVAAIALNAIKAVVFYLKKIFFPLPLSALYPASEIERVVVLAFPVLAIIAVFFLIRKKALSRETVFGAGFFLIALLPVLQFMKVGKSPVADRYLYIAIVGVLYPCVFRLVRFWQGAYAKQVKILSAAVLVCATAFFSFLTFQRVRVWHDDFSLWNDVLSKFQVSYAYTNRGEAYYIGRDLENAFSDFNEAIRLNPQDGPAFVNRGHVFFVRKDYPAAISDYTQALKINPKVSNVHYWQGDALMKMNDCETAIDSFSRALMIYPEYTEAYKKRGICYLSLGKYQSAVSDFSEVIKRSPFAAEVYLKRAEAYQGLNETARAASDLEKAKGLEGESGNRVLELLKSINRGTK